MWSTTLHQVEENGSKMENKDSYGHVPKVVEANHEIRLTKLWKKHVKAHRTKHNIKRDITIGVMKN